MKSVKNISDLKNRQIFNRWGLLVNNNSFYTAMLHVNRYKRRYY